MFKKAFGLLFVLFAYLGLSAQTLQPSDAESKVAFVIKNMGINVDGSLKGLKGKIIFNPKNLKASLFDVTVDVATINTDNTRRDAHLKKPDFFDAEKYPVIAIKTTSIIKDKNNFTAKAVLTMHGVSKNIQFNFAANPLADGYRFTGGFTLKRKDYGVGGNSMTMGDEVTVGLDVAGKK